MKITSPLTIQSAWLEARRRIELVAICLAILASPAFAEDLPPTSFTETNNREHDIVLHVTRQHFDDLTRDEFQETVPVERQILSAWVSGTARVQGQLTVELESNEDEAAFLLTLEGDAHATTVSSMRSIRVQGGGTTSFRVEKRVLFDGIAYHGQPTDVSLTSDAYVGRICSTRRGVAGRLAVGIAQRRVPQMQPEASRITERDARTRLRNEFDELANELIAELNETTPFEETIRRMFPETKTWVYKLSTTDEYIQASTGPKGFRVPALPKRGEGSQLDAVELWIRTGDSEIKPEVLKAWNVAQGLLRTFVPQDTSVPNPLLGQAVGEQVGDWVVITIGQ